MDYVIVSKTIPVEKAELLSKIRRAYLWNVQIDRIIWQFINYVLVVKNVYLHINDST